MFFCNFAVKRILGCKIIKSMEDSNTNKSWGGARKGAGRKSIDASEKRVSVTFALTAETKEKIHKAAKAQGISASEFVTRWAEQL